MGLKGCICAGDGELRSFDQCIQHHINGDGPAKKCHMPLPLLVAMSKNAHERRDAGISATMLLDCPRKIALQEEYEYYESPIAYWDRFRGTIGHLMMEAYPTDVDGLIQERRVKRELTIDGTRVEITGKPDWLDTARKTLVDFKTCKALPKELKDSHEEQLNIYRWLVADGVFVDDGEPCRFEVDRAGIQYMSMEGTIKMRVNLWTLTETEKFIKDKLRYIIGWKTTGKLPPPLPKASARTKWKCNYCPLAQVCEELILEGN